MRTTPHSHPDPRSAGPLGPGQRVALVIWIVAAMLLFLLAPSPPEPEPTTPEEEAARQRMVEWVARDVQRWQRERGDIVVPWEQAEGHMAIVIDDVGRELVWHDRLQALRFRLTFSVLPGAIYAAGVQLRLRQDHRRPREIMLHLPMEPLDPGMMVAGSESREDFLRAEDPPRVLIEKLEHALARVPAAVGINNHMGSRLTADAGAMAAIMEVVAHRHLFFVDSRTTAETMAGQSAREAGVPTLSREVFLDHDPSAQAVRAALTRAADLSRERPIVVIAHPSREVVEVLEGELPGLAERGIGIYPVTELLNHQDARFTHP